MFEEAFVKFDQVVEGIDKFKNKLNEAEKVISENGEPRFEPSEVKMMADQGLDFIEVIIESTVPPLFKPVAFGAINVLRNLFDVPDDYAGDKD